MVPSRATRKEADIASFKTPNLRNVLVTAPYFHDGSQATLWDVVDHYNKGDGIHNQFLDQDIQPLALSEREIDDLVAFMASLTSPEIPGPRAQRIGASARYLSDQSPPARHGQGLPTETAASRAAKDFSDAARYARALTVKPHEVVRSIFTPLHHEGFGANRNPRVEASWQ